MADTPTDAPDFPEPNDAAEVDADGGSGIGDGPIIEGKVSDLAIEQELADSYLTYAMSTIVDRALPDVRDGLKPSQRRILVAMNDLNLRPGSKHRKCAKIAGDTSGNYHPHGEATIYPTLVNMAQDWKMRVPLIDPQGNFGSVDPDPPAAMRYTEARMAPAAADMLDDLKFDTVDYQDNYDGTQQEPRVLPGRFPNLLINGGTGIAVGMATSLAPHNPGEIFDAITALLDNPDLPLLDLMDILKGPDFPTGGEICGRSGILNAYATGRGKVTVRGKLNHETRGKRNVIVVTELPYQVTKNDGVVDKIKQQKANGKLEGVANVTDESSNRAGMRLVIELKMAADPAVVENQLYALTPLQSTFSMINIALVNGRPVTLPIKDMIRCWLDHRVEVIRRKTAFKLRQAQQDAHRIEGLIFAVCDIDEVIRLIRASKTRDEAIEKLMARGFRIPADHPYAPQIPQRLLDAASENDIRLTRVQAEAIGRLQLIQLVGLEIEKLVSDYAKLVADIEEYEDILANPGRVRQIIRDETDDLRARYTDARRTVISDTQVGSVTDGDLIPEHQVVVTITHGGYIKRLGVTEYKVQGRGGKGVIGSKSKDEDFVSEMFVSSTHDDLLCFTNTGRVFKIKVFEIPEANRTGKGRAIINLINLRPDERVVEFLPVSDFEKGEDFLLFATTNGIVKRTALADYRNVHSGGLIAVGLKEGDSLIGVKWVGDDDHVLLGTASGMAIRFQAGDARAMGRNAAGVKGISLRDGDQVIGLVRLAPDDDALLLTVTENGFGKTTPTHEYLVQSEDGSTRTQGRGGKGRRDIKTTDRNGQAVSVKRVRASDDVMLITTGGMIVRINAGTVRQTRRASAGVRVIKPSDGDRLTAVARVRDDGEGDGEGETESNGAAEPGTDGSAT